MTKSTKTKIAFASILSLIPILVLGKLNIVSENIALLLVFIAWLSSVFFGAEYMRDFGKKTGIK